MTASQQLKALFAGMATVAAIGAAVAQGTPPNPNMNNPAVGAGQQSSQNTPMGTTGVQGAGTGATAPATGSTGTMNSSTDTSSGATTMGASPDTRATRAMRADRN